MERTAKNYLELGGSVSQIEGAKSEGLGAFGKAERNAREPETFWIGTYWES